MSRMTWKYQTDDMVCFQKIEDLQAHMRGVAIENKKEWSIEVSSRWNEHIL
jgi:hypothetical protein